LKYNNTSGEVKTASNTLEFLKCNVEEVISVDLATVKDFKDFVHVVEFEQLGFVQFEQRKRDLEENNAPLRRVNELIDVKIDNKR